MSIDEQHILITNHTPIILYRSGVRYFLQDHTNIDMPLREIDNEKAWDLLKISDELRSILRKSNQ